MGKTNFSRQIFRQMISDHHMRLCNLDDKKSDVITGKRTFSMREKDSFQPLQQEVILVG